MPDSPERCTCGTTLVEGAAFCHRCGRPTREIAIEAAEEIPRVEPPPPVAPPTPLPIGFGNPIALRVAFLMSLGAMMAQTLAGMVPGVNYLFFIWWLLAGVGCVRLYRRLTGFQLTVLSGARLGFLTGVFIFISMAAFTALGMASSAGREFLDQLVRQDPRMSEVINNPTMFAAVLFMGVVMVFTLVAGLTAAGGAIGAKYGPHPEPRV